MTSPGIVPESIAYEIHGIPPTLLMTFVSWAFVAGLYILIARFPSIVPVKVRMAGEIILEYVVDLANEVIGPKAQRFYPLLLGLFIFILISNLMGLVPGLISPTSDPALPFGLAIMVFIYFNYVGLQENGLRYFKQFMPPKLPLAMFPISVLLVVVEVISFLIRPFSLGLRLFCNIFSKELFLGILAMLVLQFLNSDVLGERIMTAGPFILRPFIMILGLVVAFIQALVFTILTMSYIAGAIQIQEHH